MQFVKASHFFANLECWVYNTIDDDNQTVTNT